MNGHTGKPIKIANKLACVGIGLGMFWWFLEAAVHVFVFHDGRLATQVLTPNLHEAWMRLLVVGLLVVFGIYAQSIIKQRERAARELKKHRNHLEELVSERNAELTRANQQLGQEIIEREGAEEALRKSEARLKSIVETVPSGLFTVDLNKRFTYWNKGAEEIVGLKAEEVIGRDCIEVLDCGECKTGCGLFDDKAGKPIYGKECVIHVDGKDIAILKNVDILRDLEGNTIGGLESFIDITKRKQAEKSLRKREEEKRAILNSMSELVTYQDTEHRVIWANRLAGESVGATPEDLVGRYCYEIWGRRSKACEDCLFPRVRETSQVQEGEKTAPDGRIWFSRSCPVRDENDNIVGVVETRLDITERKRAQEALRESQEKLAAILASVVDHMSMIDADHNIVWVNDVAKSLFGRDLVGKKCYTAYHGSDKPCQPCMVEQCFQDGKIHEHETEVIVADGNPRCFWCIANVALRRGDGRPKMVVELSRDITKRKRAAEELRTSEERYRILAENVADGVGIVQDGKLTFANVALGSIFGYAVDELVGMESIGLFRDDYKHRYKQVLEDVEKNISPKRFQAPCIRGNGRQIWIEAGHNLIAWEGKHAVLVTVRDITEAKHREMAMQDESELLRRENVRLRSSMKERYRFGNIIGKSAAMQEVYDLILKAGATDASVVIYGESGTGKELVARTIHEMSDRRHKAFVPVNCGAIPETLFESELFGHRKGAFTGAHIDKHGFFDLASRGTLFLDEVGELSPTMQVKLLRAIEGGGYTPVGDTKTKKADVRIVVATNRHLMDMLRKGLIREDFLYRIHVIPVTVPPLRDRKEDIVLLVDHFLKLYGNGKERPTMPGRILNALYSHDWPGNIRELENVLKRYLTTKRLDFIGTTHEADSMGPVSVAAGLHQEEGPGLRNALEAFEKEYINKLLARNQWHRTKTAAMLRIPERTLYRKLKQFQLTSS